MIDVSRVGWKSSLASIATMALTKLQMQRMGRGQSPTFRALASLGPGAHPPTEHALSPLAGGPDMKRTLYVVSNVVHYADPDHQTGLLL